MTAKGEIIIKNHEGTQLEGSRENSSSLISEVGLNVSLPYDQLENKIQGSRHISGLSVKKEIDRLTPQIFEIVCLGRTCKEVVITLYNINDEGDEKPYFIYTLADAKIVSMSNGMSSESLNFIAKSYTLEYLEGGITYTETAF